LANKLCAGLARVITVCFESTAEYFSLKKRQVVGNPVRGTLKHEKTKTLKHELIEKYDLKEGLPVVLIMGGGRGARSINQLTIEALPELVKFCQVVHIMGENKIQNSKFLPRRQAGEIQNLDDNYHQFDFLADSPSTFKLADLIVSRAGMSSLTEIAYLKKPAIVIPIPRSHQEDNAYYFYERGAIIALDQQELDKEKFIKIIKDTLGSKKKMKELGEKMHGVIEWGAEDKIADLVLDLAKGGK
jgi:UDP-N-acetylglucosamine--N-acetylmuramyl-(pentapeptide) pyrophosphoryl-undecaprenol N-acetylglucosamine transferase